MLENNIKYSYNDITLVPSILSEISHRHECVTHLSNGKLPIFTAPMSTVVDDKNFELFENNGINAILPRNINIKTRIDFVKKSKWVAFSLNEFNDIFNNADNLNMWNDSKKLFVLVDIANGHMVKLYDSVRQVKSLLKDKISIMVGNIANPETYLAVYESGADYVRLGIGGGSGCITSSNTGIHYPMASLVNETFIIKQRIAKDNNIDINQLPKIIADGGIRNYNDVIKALALGADYVMIGSILASLLESSAQICYKLDNEYIELRDIISISKKDNIYCVETKDSFTKDNILFTEKLYKKFYGMASKDGQIAINGEKKKTSEGITKYLELDMSLIKWVENLDSYIKSAMSYLNIKDIKDINKSKIIIISNNTYNSINK